MERPVGIPQNWGQHPGIPSLAPNLTHKYIIRCPRLLADSWRDFRGEVPCTPFRVERSDCPYADITLTIRMLVPCSASAWHVAPHRLFEVSLRIAVGPLFGASAASNDLFRPQPRPPAGRRAMLNGKGCNWARGQFCRVWLVAR